MIDCTLVGKIIHVKNKRKSWSVVKLRYKDNLKCVLQNTQKGAFQIYAEQVFLKLVENLKSIKIKWTNIQKYSAKQRLPVS